MDRRRFLGLLGGGLVASVTMAQADQLADFLNWLNKGPTAYSFPTDIQIVAENNLLFTDNHFVYTGSLWQRAEFAYAK